MWFTMLATGICCFALLAAFIWACERLLKD